MRFLRFWGFHLNLNKYIEKNQTKKRYVQIPVIRGEIIIDFKLCLSSKEIKMKCEDNYVSVVCKGQALTGCIWKSWQTSLNSVDLDWHSFSFLFFGFSSVEKIIIRRRGRKNIPLEYSPFAKTENPSAYDIQSSSGSTCITLTLMISKITQKAEILSQHIDNTHLYIIFV